MRVSVLGKRTVALLIAVAGAQLSPAVGAERQIAPMSVTAEVIKWVVEGEFQKLVLRVSGGGTELSRQFATPYSPYLKIESGKGERLPDGAYNYELRVVPRISLENRKRLAEAREAMDQGRKVDLSGVETTWRGPTVQTGTFAVVEGAFLVPGQKEPGPRSEPTGDVQIEGDLGVSGAKSFVAPDPADSSRRLVYAALEGPEAGTYYRGSATTKDGEATLELPGHFARVTEADGLTVQLTPAGAWSRLYVAERSPSRLVVRTSDGSEAEFDFLIQGVRKGYADFVVERPAASPAGRDSEER